MILMTIMLLSGGCRKDVETFPEAKTVLMTINFTANYINPKLGAIIFASDSLGNVIADTAFKGNGKLLLYTRPGIKNPLRFTLTIASWEPSMHNFEISMKSYLQVATAEWTLQGHRPDTLGHFTVSLSNIPQPALILYANAGYANLTTNYTDVTDLSYIDPDELYIKIEHNQDEVYKLISGIHPGGTYTVDMSDAVSPVFSNISMSGQYYEARIWGFRDADYENGLPVMTDFSLGSVPAGNLVRVAVLPGHFQGYHSELKLIENWDSMTSYSCRRNGDIPAAFDKIDARVGSVTTHPAGKLEATTYGDFTTTCATWQFYGRNNQSFTWTMSGNNTLADIRLPNLSANMLQTFPTFSLDSLYFFNLELTKYHDLASYQDFLNTIFDPSGPKTQNKLNASALIYGQSK